MAWVKEQSANKDYNCSGGCGQTIEKGTRYLRVTHMITHEPDVDDDGRTVAVPLDPREFHVERFHRGCDDGTYR